MPKCAPYRLSDLLCGKRPSHRPRICLLGELKGATMADLESIVGMLASSATPVRLEGADRLKEYLDAVNIERTKEQAWVREIVDAGNNMAKSHNAKACVD